MPEYDAERHRQQECKHGEAHPGCIKAVVVVNLEDESCCQYGCKQNLHGQDSMQPALPLLLYLLALQAEGEWKGDRHSSVLANEERMLHHEKLAGEIFEHEYPFGMDFVELVFMFRYAVDVLDAP